MPTVPANQFLQASSLTCADCGENFVPRRLGDGVEVLCDACYRNRIELRDRRDERLEKRVA
jgi:formylmethanofuran dehydrogenase subunit E